MKENYITYFTYQNTFLKFIFFLLLFSCSGHTNNDSQSDRVSSASSEITQQIVRVGSLTQGEYGLSKIYKQAIGDYIRKVNKEYKLTIDTLFFGKHVYGQPDDFPNIELPAVIENINIKLISPEEGKKKQRLKNQSFYINLIGSVNSGNAEFTFVTFSNGFTHQFDFIANYKYNSDKNIFEETSSRLVNFMYKTK